MRGERELLEPGGTILAVDDQETNLELLEEILVEAGYQVRLAVDGEAALAEVEKALPDCIVLDIMMPRLDGYAVCARLKGDRRTRFIPVVMLTALSGIEDKVKGLETGADDFLNKPVRREELLARVRALVRIKRLRDELDTSENIIYSMIRALEGKDPLRAGHSERVAARALAAGRRLGLPRATLDGIAKGAMLHDVGKLGVPEEVLWAPRPLPAEAEAVYRQHPVLGERILSPLKSFSAALDVVRHHHERRDGSGYPDGLFGSALSLPAELVGLANFYEDRRTTDGAAAVRGEVAAGRFQKDLAEALLATSEGATLQGADLLPELLPISEVYQTGRILVCDDTADNREMLEHVLTEAGFEVTTVDTGSAVLPTVAEGRTDLVLLDIRMPGLDGFDVCEWIKRSPETEFLPVVLVTALNDPKDRERSALVGADDFLTIPVNRLELLARVRSLLRLRMYHQDLEAHQDVVVSLASVIEAKDPYTKGHSARVGALAARLAMALGLPPEVCDRMTLAGLLHDIGKVGIPEALINKKGKLTEQEFLTIMGHPSGGEAICRPLRTVRSVLPLIRSHHERYDGKGYPDHLHGEEIPLEARVLAVADAYDALTSDRAYRSRLVPEEALAILARETVEGHWDPGIYAALAAMIRREAH